LGGCVLVSACSDEKAITSSGDPTASATTAPRDGGGNDPAPTSDSGNNPNPNGSNPSASATNPTNSSAPNGSVAPSASAPLPAQDLATFGDRCDSDEDCGASQFCLQDDEVVFGGTVAGGVCTADCTVDVGVCAQFGAGTWCAGSDQRAYCVQHCVIGSALEKCHGREDMACLPVDMTAPSDGACTPACASDEECPGQECQAFDFGISGDFLFPVGGVCVDPSEPAALKQDGEACADYSECEGQWCVLPLGGGEATICSSLCTFRTSTFACHRSADSSEPALSVCAEGVFSADPLVQEVGFCMPTCDDDADCEVNTKCLQGTQAFQADTGRFGLCGVPAAATGDAGVPDASAVSDADAG
jgi:hypothetical protein